MIDGVFDPEQHKFVEESLKKKTEIPLAQEEACIEFLPKVLRRYEVYSAV